MSPILPAINEPDAEFDALCAKVFSEMADSEKEVNLHNQEILASIPNCGDDFKDMMDCCILSEKMEWVESPNGEYQDESYGVFQNIHVDQWQNGGYSGDDFAGDIYAQVGDRWLKIPYHC